MITCALGKSIHYNEFQIFPPLPKADITIKWKFTWFLEKYNVKVKTLWASIWHIEESKNFVCESELVVLKKQNRPCDFDIAWVKGCTENINKWGHLQHVLEYLIDVLVWICISPRKESFFEHVLYLAYMYGKLLHPM